MSKFGYILIFLIVLVITIFTRWLLTSVEQPSLSATQQALHHPDYFISDVDATVYTAQGKPNYRLIANHLEHFPDNDSLEIDVLRLEYTDTSNQLWVTTSNKGTAYKDIEVVNFIDNVKVVRTSGDPNKNMTLLTDRLEVDFIKRIASTDSEVKIVGKNSNIIATGMLIELDEGKVTLNAKARAEYVPN